MLHKYLYMFAAEDGALIKTKQGVAMEVGCLAELKRILRCCIDLFIKHL